MAEGAPNRATMLVLAYLWPLALVPLLLSKDDPEVQWHARHGLVLMAAELAVFLALSVTTTIVTIVTFGLGCIISVVFLFLWAGVLLLHVGAIVRAMSGSRLIIPGVSEYASRF